MGFRRWALLGGLLSLGVGPWARADLNGTSQARLSAVLAQQRTEALTLTWTQGRAEAPQRVLKIEGGKAQLQLCRPDCVAVGASVVLTSGQRGRQHPQLHPRALQLCHRGRNRRQRSRLRRLQKRPGQLV